MKVFKFGGASLANADRFKNVAGIIAKHAKGKQDLVVVASALGKSTNELELVWQCYYQSKKAFVTALDEFEDSYLALIKELAIESEGEVKIKVKSLFLSVCEFLVKQKYSNQNYTYDLIVSLGELATTTILSGYLKEQGVENNWLDARQLIATDHTYRSGKVDFKLTSKQVKKHIKRGVYITQGFLGGTDIGTTTTLGREGSDFSAAILASVLSAEELTIWKDVDGVLTADPRVIANPRLIKKMGYGDAKNLTYFGAKVIHPKTLAPLQRADIPLRVRSFINKKNMGTLVHGAVNKNLPAYYIFKEKQVMVSCKLGSDFTASDILQLFKNSELAIAYLYLSSEYLIVVCDKLEHKIKPILGELGKLLVEVKDVKAHVFYKQTRSFIDNRVGKSKILGSNQKGDFWVVIV